MIRLLFLAVILFFQKEEVPFKPKEEFEIKLDLSFKQRAHFDDGKTIKFNETEYVKRPAEGLLPTLKMNVKILAVQVNEAKLKVVKDDRTIVYSKKVEQGMEFKIDLGFTDDLKDQIEGYKHEIQFFSPDRKKVSKILIEFDSDGNYFVNGEKLGRV